MFPENRKIADQAFDVGMRFVPNALIIPPNSSTNINRKNIFNGGVYDEDGQSVDEGLQIGMNYRQHADESDLPLFPIAMGGRHLYAGLLRTHFGNFLVECLGRLWGLAEAEVDGIIYAVSTDDRRPHDLNLIRKKADTGRLPGFLTRILNILAPDKTITLLPMPARIESLYVPTQLTLNTGDYRIGAHSVYRQFTNARISHFLAAHGPATCHRKIYVSRSQLGPNKASFILENRLDQFLQAEGYHILYPERTSIEEQLALYSNASELLFSEGSATHLFALCVKPHQRVGIILRRWPGDAKFQAELELAGCENVYSFPALAGRISAKDSEGRSSSTIKNNAPSLLDFSRLQGMLFDAGFVSGTSWPLPGRDELADAVQGTIQAQRSLNPTYEFSLTDDPPLKVSMPGEASSHLLAKRDAGKVRAA